MSRCFPFPPPGYERQHRPEDLDLLKEAKSKEKRHKKEKKDKERKKDKEKKEKDGSTEKHRDKKDKKEKHKDKKDKDKHRDKKKDKEDRNKDKEKSSISEESTVARNEEISVPKLYPVGNSKDRTSFPNEAKCSALLQDPNGSQSSLPSQRNEESRFVQELDRRIKDDKSRGSQLPERAAFVDKKDPARDAIRNSSGVLAEEKGDNKNKRVERKSDPQGPKIEFSGNTMVQNLIPIVKSKGDKIPRPVSEENGRRLEDKEKYKETVEVKRRDKQKDKSKESHGKEKDKEKERKRKDDKAKLKTDYKKSEQDKLKDDDGRNNNLGSFAGNKSSDVLKVAHNNAVIEGNIKKRKDMGTNGFLHESEIRPNKMQRPAPHQSTENGRKLEPFRSPVKSSHDKHAAPNSVGVDNKDQLMINGIFEAQKPSPPKTINAPPAATMAIDQIAESSKLPQCDSNDFKKAVTASRMEEPIAEASSRKRHPHPDSKYLAEVLTVPTNIADWSENDDQDWLFSEKVPSKPNLEPSGDDVRVWSEAVHIESVDVCALPYVLPY